MLFGARSLASAFVDGKVITGDFDIPNLQAGDFKIPAGRDGKGTTFGQGVARVFTVITAYSIHYTKLYEFRT